MSETDRSAKRYSRRRALLTVGTGLVAAVAGCSDSAESTTPPPTRSATTTPATTTDTPGATTTDTGTQVAERSARLKTQFQSVQEATAKYQDTEAARADGYAVLGPYMEGMGWHFINQGYVSEAANTGLTREKPPLLTYVRTSDGLALGAIEYAVPVDAVESELDLFADEGTPYTEAWGTHHAATHVFATPDSMQRDANSFDLETLLQSDNWSEYTPADASLSPGDTATLDWGSTTGKTGDRTMRTVDFVITHPELRTLHVWLHMDNPDGVFAETNPRFAEGDGGHHHDGGAGHHHDDGGRTTRQGP